MKNELIISAPPHFRAPMSTAGIMWIVVLSLLPVALASIYFFGYHALTVILVSVTAAVTTEAAYQKMMNLPVTISDGSAAMTGLLLALTLPPMVPWWIPLIGAVVAILIGKQLFGGLGWNIFNPALVGRAFLMLSWVKHLSKDWYQPFAVIDARTSATPLYAMKLVRGGEFAFNTADTYRMYLWGNQSGCVGEVSALLLLAGGLILLLCRIIDWRIPLTYIGTVAVLTMILGADPVFYLLAGGLFLGAFFMATDYVTSSITPRGKVIFGFGCGLITVLLRFFSGLPESVMFAILFMNMCAPLIDRYTMPKKFGWVAQA